MAFLRVSDTLGHGYLIPLLMSIRYPLMQVTVTLKRFLPSLAEEIPEESGFVKK